MKKNTTWNGVALVCAASLAILSVLAAWPFAERLGWGLDFAGGSATEFAAGGSEGLDQAAKTVSSRLLALGVRGAQVDADNDKLVVRVPSGQDAADEVDLASKPYRIELVRLDTVTDAEALARIRNGAVGVPLAEGSYTVLVDGSQITGGQVVRTSSTEETYGVVLTLDSDASQRFADATAALAPVYGQIALVVDGSVVAAPTVYQQITGGQVSVSGSFTLDEARALAAGAASGPVSVALSQGETYEVAPAVGSSALAVAAVVAAVVVVAAGAALVAWGRAAGFAAWAAWVAAELYSLGGLAAAVMPSLAFTPSVHAYLFVFTAPLLSLAAFVVLARDFRSGASKGLLRRNARALGAMAVAVVAYALVSFLLGRMDPGLAAAVALAVPAGALAGALVFFPLLRLAGPAPRGRGSR